MRRITILLLTVITFSACKDSHIKEHKDWSARFKQHGITDACFILRDHAHETVNIFNRDRCLQRFMPASTFNIFNSLVALETGIAKDDALLIPWNKVPAKPEWDKDMDMREAFKLDNPAYFQELARRIDKQNFQHYLDTIKYGNMTIGTRVDSFWNDNSLQVSADEQVGFIRKLYFEELPFIVRTQSIVKSMMLREDSNNNRLYYKTGIGTTPSGNQLLWVTGFMEHVMRVKEPEGSMNKSGVHNYPYFFALNFEVPKGNTSQNWEATTITILHDLLNDYGALRNE
jgi:beta-lactamase class D